MFSSVQKTIASICIKIVSWLLLVHGKNIKQGHVATIVFLMWQTCSAKKFCYWDEICLLNMCMKFSYFENVHCWSQFSMLHCVHCSSKFYLLKHRKETISASRFALVYCPSCNICPMHTHERACYAPHVSTSASVHLFSLTLITEGVITSRRKNICADECTWMHMLQMYKCITVTIPFPVHERWH